MIAVTPWTERKFDFNFPIGLFPIIIERLRGTSVQLQAITEHIADEKLSRKKEGKWSVKEVIGHLCDLEELWSARIDDFLAGKEILRAADMTNAKTHAAGHNERTVTELIREFSIVRQRLIEKVMNYDEATAGLTALHPRLQKPMRLMDSLYFVAEHDDHELAKIRGLLIE
jgi:uncharacterized damage-inducible protein DinB